ncbi:MAG: class I SAM-dependent methyltransferase [Cyanobacteriota bacterium]
MNFETRWKQYYRAVEGQPPRPTLTKALEFCAADARPLPRFAVDLGCGDGRDTVELLRQGWRVLAIDGEPEAIARLRQRPDLDRTHLETRVQRFEELTLPPDLSLINASFCLPFCPPQHFAQLWEEITLALAPGGRFCGQLFGDQDSWSTYPHLTHHNCLQVEHLLEPFAVEWLEEENHPGQTALGEEKHWHIFHIVARKR